MAITTRDQLVAALASGTRTGWWKASFTSVAGQWMASFRAANGFPNASSLATPTTTGRALDRTSSGAMPIPAAASGKSIYLAKMSLNGTVTGTVQFADRLVEWGGLSGTVTTAQSLSAVSLPARAGTGIGVEIWLDWYTATGSTASASVTASYTNSDGTSGRTATLVGGTPASVPANRCYRLALQGDDVGVQSVQSVTLGTSTGTAGNFGVTLRESIDAFAATPANTGGTWGYAETGLPVIPDAACIEMLMNSTSTSTGNIFGSAVFIQG